MAVFCGQVLPLNKEIIENAGIDDKRSHLLEVLTGFLHERVGKLMTDEGAIADSCEHYDSADAESLDFEQGEEPAEAVAQSAISQTEVDQFLDVDLKLLDNKAYFNSVFNGE
ncbi:MAG: hypothetical protein QGG73_08020 [Candidatus Hydrogenedentes bacterium]|nr:hypothetical protein [Candidatus Hydrogenedentota bacterium]